MFCYCLKSFFKVSISLSLFFLSVNFGFAQTPIFTPSMSITEFGSVDSPANEGVGKIIDGTSSTKFLDLTFNDGMGFTVDLGGTPEVASSISITTANDSPNRDPQNYTIYGSNNGTDFIQIATGTIPCITTRFNERTFTFTNIVAYSYYRINFTTQCGSDNSIQLSEVQLYSNSPPDFIYTTVQTGYNSIMGSVFSDDGMQMFVWEKDGRVFVSNWNGSTYIKQNTAVLDISDEVGGWRDFGLISIALDPGFSSNGLIYLSYMVDREHLMHVDNPADPNPNPPYDPNNNDYFEATITRLTRYKINLGSNPLTTDYTSRKVLLGESPTTGIPLLHESHAGGAILFGDDGTLIMTTGDNASYNTTDTGSIDHTYYAQAIADGIMRADENVGAFRSQMINSFCGKVLRMDPDTGDGLTSNPHYDSNNPRSAQSRMYAMGLRNPFRMSIKKGSGSTNPADGNPGTLFVVDVGWGTWEDLHIFDKPGLNAGWPLYEGQTQLNSYYNSGTTNPDEVGNPTFQSLCVQPTSFTDDANPVNRRYTHNRPEVAWRHGSDDARVPWFSGTTPTDPRVGTAGSPTTGVQFRGNTGVSGLYLNDCGLGSDYQGKYFFTDYVRNFINVATLNDGTANWISDIEEFQPANFGSGIVHMAQNPLDGSIFYSNIFDGTLAQITYNTPDAPTWTVEPSDMTVDCDSNSATAFINWLDSFSGEDECGDAKVTHNSSGLSDDCGNTGSETVTFTLTSYHGDTITKDVTFTIEDNTDPSWTVEPSDLTVECDGNLATAFTNWLSSFSGTDDCGNATVNHNSSGLSDDCGNTGSETVTFTLTDDCGNDITKDATFTIEDNTDPSWTVEPSDLTIECDGNSATAFTNWLASFSGTDDCGSATVTHNSSGLSDGCGNTGSEAVTFTLTDACGNDITKDATFTIEDNTDPSWTVEPSEITFSCDGISDPADAFNTWLSSFSGEDTCGTATVTNNNTGLSYDCDSVGTETVTFTLTDLCGNAIDKQVTFTVENTLGVEIESIEEIKIFPNPALNSVTISGLKSDVKVLIYDILGKQVKNLSVQNKVAYSLDLPSGIYLVKIFENEKSTIKKLIIK